MRRQVKPFVTEYRGAVRRHKDLPGATDQPQEPSAARSRPLSDAQRVFGSDAADTSYEAALRAADALFAQPAERDKATKPVATPPVPQQSVPSASDPWATEPSRLPRSRPDEVQSHVNGTETRTVHTDGDKGAAPAGRILQAIEAPQDDRFAALEAERAPKRRGRKPGSKNKPKPGVMDDWNTTPRETAQPALAGTLDASSAAAGWTLSLPTEDEALASANEDLPEADLRPTDELPAAARPRNDRFGWKRSGLRPGERWKRRLPKSAW